jgi:glycosyltransferase involved in cell wall biosynthesis
VVEQIVVNTKVLNSHTTGVQRYLTEILARKPTALDPEIDEIRPSSTGAVGHAWEQVVLPFRCRDSLLWSPANTGPLVYRKQVVTVHDVQQLEHPDWFTRRFATYYHLLLPRLVRRVARLVTISQFTKSRLVDLLDVRPERITVIPLGVDDSSFQPLPKEAVARGLRRFGLAPSSYVLYVGSLQPRKNLPGLIRAWRSLRPATRNEQRLVIVGVAESSSISATSALPSDLDGLVLLGHVPDADLPYLYSGATALVNLSFYEGFGLPALEAMACGTPVLVSDSTAFPEVVGEAGILVPPHDPDAVADALTSLIDSPAMQARLAVAGRDRARRFSWDATAARTWELLVAETIGS